MLDVDGLHAEAHTVAGGDAALQAEPFDPGDQILQAEHGRIEGFVRVEIHHAPGPGGHLEQQLIGLAGVILEVRTATDDVGPGGERIS